MGKCPSCGASSLLFVHTKQCVSCGKTVCNKCVPNLSGMFEIKTQMEPANINDSVYGISGFCSGSCATKFWSNVKSYSLSKDIGTDLEHFGDNVIEAWNKAIAVSVFKSFSSVYQKAISIHTYSFPAFPWFDSKGKNLQIYEEFSNIAKLALAQNLERCGRLEDAAKVFEGMHMYDKSRELREKERHITVKNTNVSVNLNTLLQQVKDGGIVAIFRCPHCGGKLKINRETTMDSLKICEHCNSEIQTMELADFLKTALS